MGVVGALCERSDSFRQTPTSETQVDGVHDTRLQHSSGGTLLSLNYCSHVDVAGVWRR